MERLPTENVQQYPRPPALEAVPQKLSVLFGGVEIANTISGFRVLETHHAPTYYIPRQDATGHLLPTSGGSFCEWKGRASYFDVQAGEAVARRAAWTYDAPTESFQRIAGYVAFYAGLMEACFVGEERVIPQPGDFYGGWVTSNLEGIPKGARGTEHW
ncbi:DUF427 domain-containing protein [Roseobacter sp. A03A-229]